MKHTISVLVENQFGVLARVAGLFSARGFNIDSLAVGETEDSSVSRITLVVHGDDRIVDQIIKQLNKLVDVIKVVDLSSGEMLDRELVLMKVKADAASRNEIIQIVNTFRAKIVDVNTDFLTIEVTGGESKVDAMVELLGPFGIVEMARTGVIALSRRETVSVTPKEDATPKASPAPISKRTSKKNAKVAK